MLLVYVFFTLLFLFLLHFRYQIIQTSIILFRLLVSLRKGGLESSLRRVARNSLAVVERVEVKVRFLVNILLLLVIVDVSRSWCDIPAIHVRHPFIERLSQIRFGRGKTFNAFAFLESRHLVLEIFFFFSFFNK